MIIKVKRKHIVNGETGWVHRCPVSLALQEQLGCFVGVTTGRIFAYKEYPSNEYDRYRVTKKVKAFIKAFDNDKPVKPFSFRLIKD